MSEIKAEDTNFPVRITSKLAGDLLVDSISGKEEIGRLFVFHFELLSANRELHFDKVVGQQVTAILSLEDSERHFNGYITEFRYAGRKGRLSRYQATVRPWFWFLTRTSDCRIFQDKTVPDIIKEVFKDNGMSDFKDRLTGTYREWGYCVQYRESDFNFVSRLMEQEGIYYFFEHEAGKHVLVMADDSATHSKFQQYADITFNDGYETSSFLKDYLDFWTTSQFIMPNQYAIQDFNFEVPKAKLLKLQKNEVKHEMPPTLKPEIFDYPGEYTVGVDGENYVKVRLQELECQKERVHAGGPHRGIAPGCVFTLKEYPRADQNTKHLAISVEHTINNTNFDSGESKPEGLYRCRIELMKADKVFRTARKTPKPIVQGPQTAIVVGKKDDEIFTDQYGRVKVQFHWDRLGQENENSSCWVRVSQLWAGKNWGAMHIPRIGHEVIVSFMEGDPDRPIITGRVYNAINMPPYDLEGNKTQSGIKSRSTKEGGSDNFNEIRMEDKIGEEELYFQAEKNENILVKNNKGETVGHNETISIGHDREESVGNDETIAVGNNRKETVGNDEDLSVVNNRSRNVGVDETVSIGGKRTHTVGGNETVTIGADRSTDIGSNQSIGVGSNRSVQVGSDHSVSVGGGESRNIGKKLVINAGDSILLKCGSASISMKASGDIKINGKSLILNAKSSISVKASGSVKIKGATIAEN